MKTAVFILIFLSSLHAHSQTITVKQDGSGDFTVIQQAINSSEDGDLVLVWPGTYYENISYEGRNITLASLNYTTNDPAYIDSTVINGNKSGSCIRLNNDESNSVLHGFTITNGSGTWLYDEKYFGGGLYVRNSSVEVISCNIIDNFVTGYGGGIYCKTSSLYISDCDIINNTAYHSGGGINIIGSSELVFDSIGLCNIYLNNASWGTDVHKSSLVAPIHVIADTFTVILPDAYFLSSTNGYAYQQEGITYNINHGKIEQLNNDLYVSPQGSDNNTGLSPQAPLKTLAFALKKIQSDSTKTNTIYLKNGVYSPSSNNEKFPLNLRSYIDIVGESKDSCILDADSLTLIFRPYNLTHDYSLKNLTLRNGNGNTYTDRGVGIINLFENNNVEFTDVDFTGGIAYLYSAMVINTCNNVVFTNCDFYNNYGGNAAIGAGTTYIPGITYEQDTVQFINCKIYDNKANPDPQHNIDYGGGIDIDGLEQAEKSISVYMINCQITDHRIQYFNPSSLYDCGIAVFDAAELFLINSTIGNNSSEFTLNSAAVSVCCGASVYSYNSIFYGNKPYQLSLAGSMGSTHCTLEIYNSLVQYGSEGVFQYDTGHVFHYDASNIDSAPLWDTLNIFPYCLSVGSPAIDIGTLNLPPGVVLPATDLAGNPRVYGNAIDLGAYEYGPWVGEDEIIIKSPSQAEILVYPNPANNYIYIDHHFNIPVSELTVHSIYSGQVQKKSVAQGQKRSRLDISDLPQGVYILILKSRNKIIDQKKFIIVR